MPAPLHVSVSGLKNGTTPSSIASSSPSTSHGLFSRTSSIFVSNRKARERAALAAVQAAAAQQHVEQKLRALNTSPPIPEEESPISPISSVEHSRTVSRTVSLSRSPSIGVDTPDTQHSRVPSDTSLPANLIPTRTSSKASKRTHRYSNSASGLDITAIRRSVSLRSVSSPQQHNRGPLHSSSTLALSLHSENTHPDSSTSSFSSATRPPPLLHPTLSRRQKSADALATFTPVPRSEVQNIVPPEPVRSHTDPMIATGISAIHYSGGANGGRQPAASISPLNTTNTYAANGIGSTMQVPPPVAAGSQTPQMVYQHIMDTASKRISTLDYLRKAHEGRVYWFNTLLFTKPDLLRFSYFQPARLARRATNYLLLGFSLPTILDLNSQTPTEYLRALNALLVEFDQYQQLHPPDGSVPSSLSRARVPQMFKRTAGKNRRASSAADSSFLSALSSTPETPLSTHASSLDTLISGESYTHLLTPSLPFDPDFFETFATLCDVLIDCYTKVTQLIKGPEMCTGVNSGIGDLFGKADARIRKVIVAGVVREFEERCREGVRGEVAGVGKVVLGGLM